MPEHLRALIVIMALSVVSLLIGRRPAVALGMADTDYDRRRNTWLAITLLAFLAHNFWLFVFTASAVLAIAAHKEPNRLALYFFVLFAVPTFAESIPGIGGVRQFFALSYPRVLSLVVLLPLCLHMRRQPGHIGFGKHPADWLLTAYIALLLLLQIRYDTGTNTLRTGLYHVMDVFLPYYAASRALRSVEDLRDALLAMVIGAALMVPIAAFEFVRHWLLYNSLPAALGIHWDAGGYLMRGDSLRAVATTGQSIVLGYVMAVTFVLHLGLRRSNVPHWAWMLGIVVLFAGLLAPLSRGPWVGAAAGVLVMAATSSRPMRQVVRFGVGTVIVVALLQLTPFGDRIIDHLPFVGTIDADTVNYRQRLIEVSMIVIAQNPFFGAADYLYSPVMQELQQGSQGIIDVVNSYLGVALGSGAVGLALFAGVFLSVAGMLLQALRAQRNDPDSESYLQGRVLLAVLVVVAVTIITVSSITFIPIVYWSLCGLGAGYALRVRKAQPAPAPEADYPTVALPREPKWSRR